MKKAQIEYNSKPFSTPFTFPRSTFVMTCKSVIYNVV